jgi:transcriptional regulator with XRE-family HTH domain
MDVPHPDRIVTNSDTECNPFLLFSEKYFCKLFRVPTFMSTRLSTDLVTGGCILASREAIAARIKARREELYRIHGVHTQEYMAKRLDISRTAYTAWENADHDIVAPAIPVIADLLEVSAAYLMCEIDGYRHSGMAHSDDHDLTDAEREEKERLLYAWGQAIRARKHGLITDHAPHEDEEVSDKPGEDAA